MNNRDLTENEALVLNFLKKLETRKSSAELKAFYHEEIEQIEYPNAILKEKASRNLSEIMAASERWQKVITKEAYEVLEMYSIRDTVIIEALWQGTLAIPIGKLKAGDKMKANFAQFYQIKEGKIYKQKNYDCFESFIEWGSFVQIIVWF